MAKYLHADVLDNGPAYLKANAIKVILLKAYSVGDNYTTVNSTNNIASATISSSDFGSLAGADAAARTLAFLGKSGATASANSGATPNLHIAFTDGSAKVLAVTDETSDQVITSGNTVNFPAVSPVMTCNQPT